MTSRRRRRVNGERLRIGDVVADSRAMLSPMAGFTDVAFRVLCREHGAGIVSTEQVSATSLLRAGSKTVSRARIAAAERPVMVQLVGADAEDAAAAAARLEEPDLVGINFGCPAHQVKRTGCGAALLDDPAKAEAIVQAIKGATSRPIVAKMRLANCRPIDPVAFARSVVDGGADALIVHGRTAAQGYSGRANWDRIRDIVEAVRVPVVANGDVVDGASALEALQISSAAGVAIGRAALGDPRVFRRVRDALQGKPLARVSVEQRIREACEDLERYLDLARLAEIPAAQIARQTQRFTRGVPGGAQLRAGLSLKNPDPEATLAALTARAAGLATP